MDAERVGAVLAPVLVARGLELEAVELARAGRRERVRVIVDGDGPEGTGPSLDEIAAATTAVSDALDASDVTGDAPYTLEVSSRGVSRPLTAPAHWRRNRGRLVRAQLVDGTELTGRIAASTEDVVTLQVDGRDHPLGLETIRSAIVQVEFRRGPAVDLDRRRPRRPGGSEPADPTTDQDESDEEA